MKNVIRVIPLILLGGALASCSMFQTHKSPIAQESTKLQTTGEDMKDQGQKAVSDGIELQNKAKEMHVLVEDKRTHAAALDEKGDKAGAKQLRLDANSLEAQAVASNTQGRSLEAQGRQMITQGHKTIDRGNDLEEKGEQMEHKAP